VIEGQLRFPLVARLPEDKRNGAEAIGAIMVPTASGERLPLSRLAEIKMIEGPATKHSASDTTSCIRCHRNVGHLH